MITVHDITQSKLVASSCTAIHTATHVHTHRWVQMGICLGPLHQLHHLGPQGLVGEVLGRDELQRGGRQTDDSRGGVTGVNGSMRNVWQCKYMPASGEAAWCYSPTQSKKTTTEKCSCTAHPHPDDNQG